MSTTVGFFVRFILLMAIPGIANAQHDRLLEILPRESINFDLLGINAFANESQFGTPSQQYSEIRNTLGIKHVRVLFAWTDQVQNSPDSPIDFSFYDDIVRSIPRGSRALVVIANLPSWMNNDSNWLGGNPRLTFFKLWVKKVVRRYRRKRKILGFQIFNEPNNEGFSENYVMSTVDSPDNYIELLQRSYRYIKRRARKKKVVGASTTSILQNFPETLNYNEALLSAGIEKYLDVFAIHLYGSSVERYFLGIGDLLDTVTSPIWVTESGEQGVFNQLEYVERLWPFFVGEHPAIKRFYYYRFAESTSSDSTFGLKNPSEPNPVSDLYVHIRDNN